VVQIRVTLKTRNPFTIRALSISGVTWKWHFLNHAGWPALRRQFGEGYKELRFFRRDVQPSLKLALAVYPEAHVEVDEKDGLTLYPSAPPIPKRNAIV